MQNFDLGNMMSNRRKMSQIAMIDTTSEESKSLIDKKELLKNLYRSKSRAKLPAKMSIDSKIIITDTEHK